MSVLVIAEHTRGQVAGVTGELVTAAKLFGGPVTLLVLCKEANRFDEALSFEGVDKVVNLIVPSDEFSFDVYVDAISEAIHIVSPNLVLAGYTSNSACYGGAVSARNKMGFASDVIGFEVSGGSLVAKRRFYGGKVEAQLSFTHRERTLLLLRAGIYEAARLCDTVESDSIVLADISARTSHVEYVEEASAGVDITKSDILLSIGRGIGDRENLELFEKLAEKIGATLSSSRPLVDAGWMAKERQVGQSGKTVCPKVYIAMGISGAVQHLAGMKSSERIVAINTDPDAPIFSVADYAAHIDVVNLAEELVDIW